MINNSLTIVREKIPAKPRTKTENHLFLSFVSPLTVKPFPDSKDHQAQASSSLVLGMWRLSARGQQKERHCQSPWASGLRPAFWPNALVNTEMGLAKPSDSRLQSFETQLAEDIQCDRHPWRSSPKAQKGRGFLQHQLTWR